MTFDETRESDRCWGTRESVIATNNYVWALKLIKYLTIPILVYIIGFGFQL